MHESIRTADLDGFTLPALQDLYREVIDGIDYARAYRDWDELASLLVDRELVGAVIDERIRRLLGRD